MRLLLTIKVYTFPFVFHCSMDHICQFIFSLCFFFFPHLLALEAPSDSHGSCKMKVTALFHVTIPTLRFLFHWPQTPDFSESKNRLLQTLTPPSWCSLTPFPFFSPPGVQAFIGKSRCVMPSLCFHVPDKALRLHSKWCVRETSERILYVIRLIESSCFL